MKDARRAQGPVYRSAAILILVAESSTTTRIQITIVFVSRVLTSMHHSFRRVLVAYLVLQPSIMRGLFLFSFLVRFLKKTF